jgi:DNA polymerase III sliding clamp (beta) subunit (PCNA family)
MEFYAQQSGLLDELDLMQGKVERKSTIPVASLMYTGCA